MTVDYHTKAGLGLLGILASHLVPRGVQVWDVETDSRPRKYRATTYEDHVAYTKRAARRHRRRKLAKVQQRHMRALGGS